MKAGAHTLHVTQQCLGFRPKCWPGYLSYHQVSDRAYYYTQVYTTMDRTFGRISTYFSCNFKFNFGKKIFLLNPLLAFFANIAELSLSFIANSAEKKLPEEPSIALWFIVEGFLNKHGIL